MSSAFGLEEFAGCSSQIYILFFTDVQLLLSCT